MNERLIIELRKKVDRGLIESELAEQAIHRLSYAPNLCGMDGPVVEHDAEAVLRLLLVCIEGGFSHGILPMVRDVLFFLRKSERLEHGYGSRARDLSLLIAAMMDDPELEKKWLSELQSDGGS